MSISHGYAFRQELEHCTELVLVCCHATYHGDGSDTGEDQWILHDYQRSNRASGKPSEHETFIAHIQAGALAAQSNPHALLIFSGGMTQDAVYTEAEGYEKVFHSLGTQYEEYQRYDIENWATDSYQNLLFSIIRFRQVTGHYPQVVTVVTHAFKQDRFLELHAPAIKWPPDRIRVQGINPPFTLKELEKTHDSELERAFEPFAIDPYGAGAMIVEKRKARNWDDSRMLSSISMDLEPEVRDLLVYTGAESGREIFPGRLPWEGDDSGSPRCNPMLS